MASNPPPSAMATALARLWARFLPEIENRVHLLKSATEALSSATLTPEQRESAHDAAHKLAGTLGTFGLHCGTELARQAELYFAGENPSATASEVVGWVSELSLLIKSRK